jgi:lipid-binding SYLF domain-containing protein
MKTKIGIIILMLSILSIASYSQKYDIGEAKSTIKEFQEKDPGMNEIFSSAFGYAVFPGIGKGGLGIGGAGGKGTVYKGGTTVADVKMSQVTIGFQAGGQKYAEVIFFENDETYNNFISGDFEFAAQVSAVALTAGASADAPYEEGLLVVTMTIGGLMYEASVGGQKFKVTPY